MYLPVDRGAVQKHRAAFCTVRKIFRTKSSAFGHCASFHLMKYRNIIEVNRKAEIIFAADAVIIFVLWVV